MRVSIIIIILVLFSSCSNKKLDGFWYAGMKFESNRYPDLIKFENGYFIDYFTPYDTIKYRYFFNKLYTTSSWNGKRKYKISLSKTKLSFFDSKSDTLIVRFNKRTENNFVYDFLNDKSLSIDLPSGNGLEKIIGLDNPFENPLYLSYKDSNLIANFLDTTHIVDNDYFEFVRERMKSLEMDIKQWERYRVSLIADKNIKISDLNLLRKQLKIAGFSYVHYFLKSNSYDKFNLFSHSLKELSKEEISKFNVIPDSLELSIPLPSVFEMASNFKGQILFFEIDKNIIKLNDSIITDSQFKNLILSKDLSKKDIYILYYLTENSVYQDYANFNNLLLNCYYDAWDHYLMNKYGIKFRGNKRFDVKRDARINIPLILSELDKVEYEKLKYSL